MGICRMIKVKKRCDGQMPEERKPAPAQIFVRLLVGAKRQSKQRTKRRRKEEKKKKKEKKKVRICREINRQNRPWRHSDCNSRNSCRIARYPATTRFFPDSWIAGNANNGRYQNWNRPRWGLWRRRKPFLYCRRKIAVGLGQKASSL